MAAQTDHAASAPQATPSVSDSTVHPQAPTSMSPSLASAQMDDQLQKLADKSQERESPAIAGGGMPIPNQNPTPNPAMGGMRPGMAGQPMPMLPNAAPPISGPRAPHQYPSAPRKENWKGALHFKGAVHGQTLQLAVYANASTGDPELAVFETWPQSINIVQAISGTELSLIDIMRWVATSRAALVQFSPRQPVPESFQQSYDDLVQLLTVRKMFATGAWMAPGENLTSNIFIFPVPGPNEVMGLMGACFPMTGIPDLPGNMPIPFPPMDIAKARRKHSLHHAHHTMPMEYRALIRKPAIGGVRPGMPMSMLPNAAMPVPGPKAPQQYPSVLIEDIWTGTLNFKGGPDGQTQQLTVYVTACSVNRGLVAPETWPEDIHLVPAIPKTEISVDDILRWIKVSGAAPVQFSARQPASGGSQQAFKDLVQLLTMRKMYATGAWMARGANMTSNILIFPVPSPNGISLAGACFPMTGIPDLPGDMPIPFPPMNIAKARHVHSAHHAYHTMPKLYREKMDQLAPSDQEIAMNRYLAALQVSDDTVATSVTDDTLDLYPLKGWRRAHPLSGSLQKEATAMAGPTPEKSEPQASPTESSKPPLQSAPSSPTHSPEPPSQSAPSPTNESN